MSYDIVTGSFCATYYANYKVPSSKPGEFYTVHHDGTGPAHCTCKAYEFSKDRHCKHISYVFEHACMWNCQWCDGHPDADLKPQSIDTSSVINGDECPVCHGPVVAVRIAV